MNQRDTFYADLIVIAIQNRGYGSFETLKYDFGMDDDVLEYERMPTAVIEFYNDPEPYTVTKETFTEAFSTLKKIKPEDRSDWTKRMLYNYNNVDYADFDVVDALNLLEIGIFGKVIYN